MKQTNNQGIHFHSVTFQPYMQKTQYTRNSYRNCEEFLHWALKFCPSVNRNLKTDADANRALGRVSGVEINAAILMFLPMAIILIFLVVWLRKRRIWNTAMTEDLLKSVRSKCHPGHDEVCFAENEACLQKTLVLCDKNPGHKKFVPADQFGLGHLPPRYRKNWFLDLVMALANITVLLKIMYVSEHRPKTYVGRKTPFPFYEHRGIKGKIISGTGWISKVDIHQSECQCSKCRESPGVHKPYGIIWIKTASHVVYDHSEAEKTTCSLSLVGADKKQNKRLIGFCSDDVHLGTDFTQIYHETHDMALAQTLKDSVDRYEAANERVKKEYASEASDPNNSLVLIVSHPHGQDKQISIGNRIYKLSLWEFEEGIEGLFHLRNGAFRYNTPTCPGSSGALVYILSHYDQSDTWCHSRSTDDKDYNQGSLTFILSCSMKLENEAHEHGLEPEDYRSLIEWLRESRHKLLVRPVSLDQHLEAITALTAEISSEREFLERHGIQSMDLLDREQFERLALKWRDRMQRHCEYLKSSLRLLMESRDSGAVTDQVARIYLLSFLFFDEDSESELDFNTFKSLLAFLHNWDLLKIEDLTRQDLKAVVEKLFSAGHISLVEYIDLFLKSEKGPAYKISQRTDAKMKMKLKEIVHHLTFWLSPERYRNYDSTRKH